jgi:hypothetical protein
MSGSEMYIFLRYFLVFFHFNSKGSFSEVDGGIGRKRVDVEIYLAKKDVFKKPLNM